MCHTNIVWCYIFYFYGIRGFRSHRSKQDNRSPRYGLPNQRHHKKIFQADEMPAKAAVDDAKATAVTDPKNQDKVDKEIAKAEDELAKAEDKLNEGKPDKAIDHYKKAWEHAQHAIKHAQKLPKK